MKILVHVTTIVALLVVSAPANAQSGGRTCQYDLECEVGESCSLRGRCVARGALGGDEQGAADECGSDRRCRIDRLKRKNRARRHARTLDEERRVRNMIERQKKKRLEEFPRLADPLSADLRVSRLGPLGLHAGYVFGGHIQPELAFGYSDLFADVPAEGGSPGLNGTIETWWFAFGATYFLLDSWFSPYLSAGFALATGRYYAWATDEFSVGASGSSVRSKFHAGEFGGGIDLQFKFGLHTRLGLVYRPLIYNQARIGPGQYDPLTRQGLADWFRQAAAVDVIWLIGWAI